MDPRKFHREILLDFPFQIIPMALMLHQRSGEKKNFQKQQKQQLKSEFLFNRVAQETFPRSQEQYKDVFTTV